MHYRTGRLDEMIEGVNLLKRLLNCNWWYERTSTIVCLEKSRHMSLLKLSSIIFSRYNLVCIIIRRDEIIII